MRPFFLCAFLLALSNSSAADSYAPSHYCSKPYKPYEFTSQWEVDSFYDEVESYKQCIQYFIDEQEDAISNHQQAIEEAIDEWNFFVNFELN